MCQKIITDIINGMRQKRRCERKVHQDGLCKKHFDSHKMRMTNWIDRPNYREITFEEMERGCSMQLKHTNQHLIHRYKRGMIFRVENDREVVTTIAPDHTLFAIKTL